MNEGPKSKPQLETFHSLALVCGMKCSFSCHDLFTTWQWSPQGFILDFIVAFFLFFSFLSCGANNPVLVDMKYRYSTKTF